MKSFVLAALAAFICSSGLAQPCRPPLQPEPRKVPRPLPWRSAASGSGIAYWLINLGTEGVKACYEVDGQRFDLTNTIGTRQGGDRNRPTPSGLENFFDRYTGNRWNWVGFANSGGRLWPGIGAIGDLDVPAVNRFDQLAREHDLNNWLVAHFEEHAEVHIVTRHIRDLMIRVPNGLAIQAVVATDFKQTANHTLLQAQRRALAAHDNALVAKINVLLAKLRSVNPLDTGDVIREIFNDPKLTAAIPPP